MKELTFSELELHPALLRATEEMGFETASPIQQEAIPYALAGLDLVGQAQTGTGKTAAFGLPMLQKMNPDLKKVQGLILCPTRELAIQVSEEIRKLAKYMHGIKTLAIYGGQDINRQIKAMKGGVTIVIGTPGRVMDHMRRKTLRFDDLKVVTLDEADEMLNMGFRDDIETILKETPETRQTLLFSATMPKPIMEIAETYQKDAKVIKVVKKELTVDNIKQTYYRIRPHDRMEALCRLFDTVQPNLSVVFCNTKREAGEVAENLNERGYHAEALHGDLKQHDRDRVMNSFRKGTTDILVATDVAARGIDVDDVEAVFNFELPQDDEYYVHRIGRTGRAGREGLAFSFVSSRDYRRLKAIERYCHTKIELGTIPTLKEVRKKRFDKIFKDALHTLETSETDTLIERIMKKCEEEQVSPIQIAAAFFRRELGEDSKKEILPEKPFSDYDRKSNKRRGSGDNDRRRGGRKGYDRLFLNIGTKASIKPGDILGAIAGEVRIPGKQIGAIDMYDKYSFVEVPKELTKKILQIMNRSKIKGKSVHFEKSQAKTATGSKHHS